MPDPLFAGMTPQRKQIVYAYERLRFRPGGGTLVRRISQELRYTLDKNRSNSFVAKVVREYVSKRK